MKTITTFLFLIVSLVINAQTTYVPDDNFEQYLISQGYDDVMDNNVLTSKINTITTLNLRQKGILDITGINDFLALKELNISNNTVYNMGSLAVVDISGLINLEKLDANYNDIASIDLSNNTKLTDLNLEHNKLTTLTLLTLPELMSLKVNENKIETLDLTNNTKLRLLNISRNSISSTLDLSNLNEITDLNASENSIDNLLLNAAAKTSLFEINVEHNKLTSLNFTDYTGLFKVFLAHNELTSVILGGNTSIYRFSVNNNKLTSLDFNVERGGLNLEDLNCSYNQLTTLTVSSSIGTLNNFKCNNNQLSSFVVDGIRVNDFDISDNPGVQLSKTSSGSIKNLYINNNGLTSIGINPSTLTSLWCRNNNLTSLDGIDDLYILDCGYNKIETLNITADSKISQLYCNSNNLTSIDVLPKNITTLNCRNNIISTLNLDNISAWYFKALLCDSNKIETLDLERFGLLDNIYCSHNNLISLNLTNQTYSNPVYRLNCSDNKLTELNLRNIYIDEYAYPRPLNTTNNPDLTCIYVSNKVYYDRFTNIDAHSHYVMDEEECSAWSTWVSIPDSKFENALINQGYDDIVDGEVLKHNIIDITELTITNLKIKDLTGIEEFDNLTELNFSRNYVATVDLSKNTKLKTVICSMNPVLASIDISNNPDVWFLNCNATPIAQLDLSKNGKLRYLECNSTELTELDLTSNPLLKGVVANNCKLTSIDFRNHTAANVESINTLINPDLKCLFVDDVTSFKAKFTEIDATTTFVANEAECEAIIAVSIENIKESIQIDIFPNPASDHFNIDTKIRVDKVTVYNLLGEVIKVYSNQLSGRYSTSDLPTGSYFIFIETDRGNSVTKLIIKKS